MTDCQVSVICITYNQKNYIRDALDSMINQKIGVPFEIIVHDDASTDGTRDIVKEYQERYPKIIRALYEEENLFSKGIDFFRDIVVDIARGKYIAICEGDDYWTSDDKIRMQWEMLEEHPECDMCACRAKMMSSDGHFELGEIRPREGDGILSMGNVILGGGMYLATASLFFRKSMYNDMMEFEKIRSLDYVYQMKGALRGGICYIDRAMAAYRRYSAGSQTAGLTKAKSEMMSLQIEQEKRILRTLDRDTKGVYHSVIEERLKDYDIGFYDQLMSHRKEITVILAESNRDIYIWGMGLRGRALEQFCKDCGVSIAGVCDVTEKNIGGLTEYGTPIVSTHDVIQCSGMILASVEGAYRYLLSKKTAASIVNMFPYMSRA